MARKRRWRGVRSTQSFTNIGNTTITIKGGTSGRQRRGRSRTVPCGSCGGRGAFQRPQYQYGPYRCLTCKSTPIDPNARACPHCGRPGTNQRVAEQTRRKTGEQTVVCSTCRGAGVVKPAEEDSLAPKVLGVLGGLAIVGVLISIFG